MCTSAFCRHIVGIAFLVPGLHTLYFGSAAARTVAPVTPDYVSPGDNLSHTSLHPLWFGSTRNPVELRSLEYHPAQLALVPVGGVLLLGQRSCNKVESFGLYANNLRRLKYSGFRGRVYVYVGPISKPQQGTEVYLFSTDGSAPPDGKIDYVTFQRLWGEGSPLRQAASIHAPGDSVTFPYGATQYRLTVQQIYKVLLGADEIVVDMCAL